MKDNIQNNQQFSAWDNLVRGRGATKNSFSRSDTACVSGFPRRGLLTMFRVKMRVAQNNHY